MPFQNLRVNSEFFILHKDNTPYIEVGSVSGVSTPVAEFMQQPLPYGQPPRMVVVLADSLCDYCKGCISVFVPGYVTGDFLYPNVKV